ncbi:MAG TPA: hypothetical protein VF407_06025, partial [Polyangiaceae bacterium]
HARTSSLSWIRMPGAESCVPTQDLARDVETRLARPVFVSASQGDVSIEGRIEHRASKWHAIIVMRDAKGATIGTRELDRQEASCDGMREPLALVIAVMIDPDAALAKPTPPPPVDPNANASSTPNANANPNPTPAPIPEAPPPNPTPEPPKPAPSPFHFEASASFLGAAGLTPSFAPGVGVNSLIEFPHVPIAIDGVAAIFLDQDADATASDGRKATTSFTLAYLGGGLCPLRFRSERLHVFGCLVSELGVLRAKSQGFSTTDDKLGVLYNIGVEGRITVRIAGPLAFRAGVSGVVPVIRSPFVYDKGGGQTEQIFQVAPVAATGDVGLGFLFP